MFLVKGVVGWWVVMEFCFMIVTKDHLFIPRDSQSLMRVGHNETCRNLTHRGSQDTSVLNVPGSLSLWRCHSYQPNNRPTGSRWSPVVRQLLTVALYSKMAQCHCRLSNRQVHTKPLFLLAPRIDSFYVTNHIAFYLCVLLGYVKGLKHYSGIIIPKFHWHKIKGFK